MMTAEEIKAETDRLDAERDAGRLTEADHVAAMWKLAMTEDPAAAAAATAKAKAAPGDLYDRVGAAVAAGLRAFATYGRDG